jgi:hypothetical protein
MVATTPTMDVVITKLRCFLKFLAMAIIPRVFFGNHRVNS